MTLNRFLSDFLSIVLAMCWKEKKSTYIMALDELDPYVALQTKCLIIFNEVFFFFPVY